MQCLEADSIFKYRAGTLQYVRQVCNFDKPGELDSAIDILVEWLKKEDHILKKDFSRDYLERVIIRSKGSIERSKLRIDKICTCRTLTPKFFSSFDVRELTELDVVDDAIMPDLTKDDVRVYILRNTGKRRFTSNFFTNYYIRMIYFLEYVAWRDYSNGFIVIIDFRETNVVEQILKTDLVEMQQALSIVMNSYAVKFKGLHVISTSKWVDAFLAIFKQVISTKLVDRIKVHKDLTTLNEYVDRDVLPEDYGGKAKLLKELNHEWLKVFESAEFVNHLKEMQQAKTNETLRQTDKFNEQHLGMPGSFRSLVVD